MQAKLHQKTKTARSPAPLSKLPGVHQLKLGVREIPYIACRQSPAMNGSDGRDHAVLRRHGMPHAHSPAHDFAIGQCGLFRQAENAPRKPPTPIGKALIQPVRTFIRTNFLNTEGNLGNDDGRQGSSASKHTSQSMTLASGAFFSVSEMTLVSRKITGRDPNAACSSRG